MTTSRSATASRRTSARSSSGRCKRVVVDLFMRRRTIVFVTLLALSGCSVDLVAQDPPRDIDGDGRASFRDLHAPRSDARFPAHETNTRDYGERLSDHM